MHDVVVVGARCAGASTAMLLARAGHRVVLVDRATFPSDTMSTHFLWQRGAARLESWGLLDRLRSRGCAPIKSIKFDVGPVQLSGIGPAVNGVADSFCPRRTVLDALLVEAAVESGVELIEDFTVSDVSWSADRVTGVFGRVRGGTEIALPAKVVVGADGLRSTIAKRVGADAYCEHAPLTGVHYSYWSGINHLGASFHARKGRLILVWPTNDDLTCVFVAWPHAEFPSVRRELATTFAAALDLVPSLRDAVESGTREQPFTGTGHLPNQYRLSAGPGWALVGDAGHFKDPSTGMGMSDAFMAAELVAEAIDQGLTGSIPIDKSLAAYQRHRDDHTANGFALTLSTARLAPLSPTMEAFYREAVDQPATITRIFGVLGGSVPMRELV
ncbi:MAG: NAD(P)/FAD-dependent oxidoreductase [Ilumatobacteraceae bacterium]